MQGAGDPIPTTARPVASFAVVLLAAGASTRMGRPKLLLPWDHTTILGHLMEQWRQLCPRQIGVVLDAANTPLLAEVEKWSSDSLGRVFNPNPARGMFSSVQAAAAWDGWRADITHWLISLGDQPQVRLSTLERLLAESAAHPDLICQPARGGRPRHPAVLPANVFRELAAAPEENLKQFLCARTERRHVFEVDDPGLDLDLDYPADYEKARPGRTISLAGLIAVLLGGLPNISSAADSPAPAPPTSTGASTNRVATQTRTNELPITTLRGRVLCLSEEMERRHGIPLPTRHTHLWAFRATNGLLYTILPGRYAESIFQDSRVREKELELRVRIPPQTQAVEIQTVRSLRAGVVHDLYYYCDVCAIKSVSPEICACCQGPVELMEKPQGEDRE